MASKKITDEEIVSYLNKELDQEKLDLIESFLKTDKKLKIRIDAFKDLDNKIIAAANEEYPIPSDFLKVVQNTVSQKNFNDQINISKKILNWLESFSPFSLVSGSALSGAVVAGFCVLSFMSYNNNQLIDFGNKNSSDVAYSNVENSDPVAFRDTDQFASGKLPIFWDINEDIAFSVDYYSRGKIINVNENIKTNLINEIVFNIIPLKSKIIEVQYVNNKKQNINIYSNLSIKKGITFTSKKLLISDTLWIDKIIIYENKKLILEHNVLLKK